MIIESNGFHYRLDYDGFTRNKQDLEEIAESITDLLDDLSPYVLESLTSDELQQIADPTCSDHVKRFHDPNAFSVSISAMPR